MRRAPTWRMIQRISQRNLICQPTNYIMLLHFSPSSACGENTVGQEIQQCGNTWYHSLLPQFCVSHDAPLPQSGPTGWGPPGSSWTLSKCAGSGGTLTKTPLGWRSSRCLSSQWQICPCLKDTRYECGSQISRVWNLIWLLGAVLTHGGP